MECPSLKGMMNRFPRPVLIMNSPITPQTIPAAGTTHERELEGLASYHRVRKDVRATLPDDRRCVLGCLLNRTAEHEWRTERVPNWWARRTVAGCAEKPAGLEPASAQLPPSEDRLNHPRG